jgi:eukaryotic-like serine/threonine-protein kinase
VVIETVRRYVSEQGNQTTPIRIGKYDILDVLGRGGMGVVYRARDSRIGRNVAIKTLTEGFSGNEEMLKRFYQEAGHTGNLRHPNIVIIYDFGDENGLPYIVMEYLDGDPLDQLIREKIPLHLSVKLEIIEQVCLALSYAHAQGTIHRDVKPANVIVQQDGLAKLLDFGIARADEDRVDGGMTRTGTLVGTPAYMAPERLEGVKFDGRSDIFSVGVVLYQLLTGRLPFDADYPAILTQILQQDPPPLREYLPAYPPELDQVLEKSLAKNPADRYSNAGDMAADLNTIGSQLKAHHVAELLTEAKSATNKGEYVEAKQLIRQILRIDNQNADAKKLNSSLIETLRLQETRRRVEQLTHLAEEAIEARNWDNAVTVCREGLALDEENERLAALMADATAGQERKERVRKLLREAETARASGNLDAATESAKAASELEPSDSKILAICTVLAREAAEQRRKGKLRELLAVARERLALQSLREASEVLAQAEELEPSNPEIQHLKDEIQAALEQQERKQVVNALAEKAIVAITFEQIHATMKEIVSSLERFPTEPTLIRLKMQLEPRLKEQLIKRMVAEVNDACRKLSPADAIGRVREALEALPGNPELLELEFAISQRLTRQQRDQCLAEHLAKARNLLEDHLYLETVKVLETAEREGFSSPEMTELLEMARSSASERVSQDLVERSFIEAKKLMSEQNYEAVLRLIPPVLQRVDEPALRRQLEEATRNQAVLRERVEHVISEVRALQQAELFEAAIGLISAESPGVQRAKEVQTALQASTQRLKEEASRLSVLGGAYASLGKGECPEGVEPTWFDAGQRERLGTRELEKRLKERMQSAADDQLRKSVESAKVALASEDAAAAEEQLQKASPWLPSSSLPVQSEWKAAQAEVIAAKKVLRFRNVLRRRA